MWVCIPSKRPVEVVAEWAAAWKRQGYRVALWRDIEEYIGGRVEALIYGGVPYPGYALAVNQLVDRELHNDPDCNWIVTGGDDVFPDPNHTADEIARECEHHFSYLMMERTGQPHDICRSMPGVTFGVMQATGDRYGEQPTLPADHPLRGPYITRVCGSPWMGREFCLRVNQGRGPLWPEYTHMFVDEELQAVAD